jgi:ubiquinone/menaquinone biosynthesis C-methylase UbiE
VDYWDGVALLIRQGVENYPPLTGSLFRDPASPHIGLDDLLGSIQGTCICELGCGHGHILQAVSSKASHAIGIDFSPLQLELAKEKHVKERNIEFLKHDLNNGLPTISHNVSCYFSIYGALDFVEEPLCLLSECWKTLPVRGSMVILSSFLPLTKMITKLNKCNVEISVLGFANHHAIRIRKF